jgi:protocatechuate 3,4-dioxygenase beta subunit
MKKLIPERFVFAAFVLSGLLLSLNLAGLRTVSAQDLDNVTITGKVVDQNGAVIPGASVEAVLVKTGATR